MATVASVAGVAGVAVVGVGKGEGGGVMTDDDADA